VKAKKFLCAFVFLFDIASLAASAPDTNVHFTLMRGSVVVVPVLVNGRGPYEFVLDTGCESSQIDLALATELQLQIVDRVVLFTPIGQTTMGRAFAEQIALGSAKVAMSELLVGRLATLPGVSPRIRGILGQNFLYHFNYLLDYGHSRIEFEPEQLPGTTQQESRMPVTRQHGLTVLAGRIPEGETVRLLLDSGSSGLILFRENLHGFVPCHTQVCGAEVRSSNGSQRVDVGTVRRMDIGNASLHSLPAAVVRQSDRDAGSLDGLLPTNLFGAVYFNNRQNYIVVQPRGHWR
jgi:hypothetical protein